MTVKSGLQAKIDELEIQLNMHSLEIQLLLIYIQTVVDENECLCGTSSFTDGNPCSVCEGVQLLSQFKEHLSRGPLPEGKTLIVDLDRVEGMRIYLDRINRTPFEQMIFVKDRPQVQLMAETLEKWSTELELLNIDILKRIYQMTWEEK